MTKNKANPSIYLAFSTKPYLFSNVHTSESLKEKKLEIEAKVCIDILLHITRR